MYVELSRNNEAAVESVREVVNEASQNVVRTVSSRVAREAVVSDKSSLTVKMGAKMLKAIGDRGIVMLKGNFSRYCKTSSECLLKLIPF